MNILLVYPHYPATFWSFRYAMKFIDRKASFPPLGLLTVAAMLPGTWQKRLIRFIQESGIVTAMVGVLSALRGTRLYQRLDREGRLLKASSGDNTAIDLNFIPRMQPEALIAGYQSILTTIYAPKQYYQRVINLFREYQPRPQGRYRLQSGYIGAFFKSMLLMGVLGKGRRHYWKLILWSLCRKPRLFPLAITYAIYGYHFRKVTEQIMKSGSFGNQGGWEETDGQPA